MTRSQSDPSTKAVFSASLAKLRQEAGFRSAYQFYHDNGGRRQFPFTFGHYLRIEKGTILPRPEWVARLLTALRISPGEKRCRDFLTSYLKSLLGSEGAFDTVAAPLLAAPAARPGPTGGEALRWMKAQHMVHMTPEQFAVVAADEAAYWCSEALGAEGGPWTAEKLAAELSLPLAAVCAALPRLVRAKLARKAPNGRWRSRYEGKIFTFPGRLQGMLPALRRVQSYWDRAAGRTGKELMTRVELVRADESAMRGYAASLAEAVEGAIANSTHDKGPGTGFFLVEARARKLKTF